MALDRKPDALYDLEGAFVRTYEPGPFHTIAMAVEGIDGALGMRTFRYAGRSTSGRRIFVQDGPTEWPVGTRTH